MPMKKGPPKSRAKARYKNTSDDSNTAPGMKLATMPTKSDNAKGEKRSMAPKQGVYRKVTKKTKAAAMKTRRQPSLKR